MAENNNFLKNGQPSQGLQKLCIDNNHTKNTLEKDYGSQSSNKVNGQTHQNTQIRSSTNEENDNNSSEQRSSLLFYNNEFNSMRSVSINNNLSVPSDCHSQSSSSSSLNDEKSTFNDLNGESYSSRYKNNDKIPSPKDAQRTLYFYSQHFNTCSYKPTSTGSKTTNLNGSQNNFLETSSDEQQQIPPAVGLMAKSSSDTLNEQSTEPLITYVNNSFEFTKQVGAPENNSLISKESESEVSSELSNITESSQRSSCSSYENRKIDNKPFRKNIVSQIPMFLRKSSREETIIKNTKKENLGELSKRILKMGSVSVNLINKYKKNIEEIHATGLDKKSLRNVPFEISRLSDDIWKKYKQYQQSLVVDLIKLEAWKRLYVFLKSYDDSNELFIVGSFVTGFSLNGSNLDLCLLTNRDDDAKFSPFYNAKFKLEGVRLRLKNFEDIRDLGIVRGRAPMLKFTIKISGDLICVRMACNTEVGIINSQLMNTYANCDDRVRPTVSIIKCWAGFHHINDPVNNSFSSYALTLLVISFLQHCKPPIIPIIPLPSCKNLDKCEITKFDILNVLKLNSSMNWHSSNTQTLGELLIDFFRFCSTFNFNYNMVSVRVGGVTVKLDPLNSNRYPIRKNLIYIEDPIKRTNAACAIHNESVVKRILAVFKDSYDKINKNKLLSEILE